MRKLWWIAGPWLRQLIFSETLTVAPALQPVQAFEPRGRRDWDLPSEHASVSLVLQADISASKARGEYRDFCGSLPQISKHTGAPQLLTSPRREMVLSLSHGWRKQARGKAVFHQGHAVSLSHWPTVCSLVCRGYTENRKTTFFSLVQGIFHSYKNPPEQLKCKTKEFLPSSTGLSSWATRQGPPESQHVEMERIKTQCLPYFPNKTHTLCTCKLQFFMQPPSEGHCGSAPPPAGDHPVLWGIPTWDYPGASSCF